jgi:hypothetical protein
MPDTADRTSELRKEWETDRCLVTIYKEDVPIPKLPRGEADSCSFDQVIAPSRKL